MGGATQGLARSAIVILGFAVMIVAAPASQYFLIVAVVENTKAGFNESGGVWAILAATLGWLPGAMLGGAIASAGAAKPEDRRGLFQLVTSLGFIAMLVSCATVTNPFNGL